MTEPTPSRRHITRVDLARNFPYNTCGSTRSLQIIAEQLFDHGESSYVNELPQETALQIAHVVEELYAARTLLRELGYQAYRQGAYGKTQYRRANR